MEKYYSQSGCVKMKKNVIIAGASGFIGSRVTALLKKKGYGITALVRDIALSQHIAPYVDRFIEADLSREIGINPLTDDSGSDFTDAIFLAGSVNYHHDFDRAYAANVKTAVNFTRIIGGQEGKKSVKRYLFVGSVASHGFLSHEPLPDEFINEDTDYYRRGLSVYSDIKREAVNRVLDLSGELSLNPVVIEPGSLVGTMRGKRSTTNTGLMKKILKGMPVLSGGASYTSAERVSRGIVSALERGRPGNRYLLGGENMPMKDFARLVRKIAFEDHWFKVKGGIPLFTIPPGISRFLGYAGVVLNSQQALLGNSFHYMDSSKASRELGYTHSPGDLRLAVSETLGEIIG